MSSGRKWGYNGRMTIETNFRFVAVMEEGVVALPIAAGAAQFDDLLAGLPVGVYSALRTFDHNRFLYLEAHLARTERSMRLLGWTDTLDRQRLCAALHEVVTAVPWPDSRVRFDMLAQPAPEQLGVNGRLLIAAMPLTPVPAPFYETGVAVGLASGLHRENPLAKTAVFTQQRAAFWQEQHSSLYEYILVSDDGHLLEGTSTNFWGVRQGVLYTAGEGVLEGITRKIILQLATELGIAVRLQALPVDEIDTLDEAALSGSSRAFLPVVRIGEQVVGNGRPGPISRQLLAAYYAFLAREIRPAVVDK